ncbi:MAG: hypothetical protein COC01_02115 [Bacteroidetes bacterium]|nr:MAG: hypothetical protein COC01_02115 [Bacteroidota bacterium]
MQTIRHIVSLFLLLAALKPLHAQVRILPLIPPSTDTLAVCLDTFQTQLVVINDTVQIDSMVIEYYFPNGVFLTEIDFSKNLSATDTTNANQPMFFTGAIAAGDSLIVHFSAFARCDFSGSAIDSIAVHYFISGGQIDTSVVSQSYNLITAELTMGVTDNGNEDLNVGFQFLAGDGREITICNNSFVPVNNFTFTSVLEPEVELIEYFIRGDSGDFTITDTSGVIAFNDNFFNTLTGDSIFFDECIIITERIKVVSCTPGQTDYFLEWGCNEQVCQQVALTGGAEVNVANAQQVQPSIFIFHELDSLVPTNYCSADTGTASFRFENTGTDISGFFPFPGNAMATDLGFSVRYSYDFVRIMQIRMAGMPVNSIPGIVTSFSTITYKGVTDTIIGFDLSNVDTNFAPGVIQDVDRDGFFDDLRTGGSFALTIDYKLECDPLLDSCPHSREYRVLQIRKAYSDQCGEVEKSFLSSHPVAELSYGSGSQTSTSIVPPDIEEDSAFTYTVCPRFSQGLLPGFFSLNCPTDSFAGVLTLPPGYFLADGADNITTDTTITVFFSGGDSIIVDVFQVGDSVFFPFGPFPRNFTNPNITVFKEIQCIDIRMVLNCDDTTQVANFGTDTLSFALNYLCETNCGCIDRLVCSATTAFHHCDGACGKIPSTSKERRVERASFGWVMPPAGTFYTDSSRNAADRITRDTAGVRLNAAYECDSVLFHIPGSISSPANPGGTFTPVDSVFVQIRYFPPGDSNIFEFAGGTFTVINTDTIHNRFSTLTFDAIPPVVSDTGASGGKMFFLDFHVPNDSLRIDTFDTSPIFFDITADLFLTVKKSSTIPFGFYELENMRMEYFAIDNTGDTISSCDHWGAGLTLLKPLSFNFTHVSGSSGCSPHKVKYTTRTFAGFQATNDEDFPNEFRNNTALSDTISIRLSSGYNYVAKSAQYFFNATLFGSSKTTKLVPDPTRFQDAEGFDTLLTFTGFQWPLVDVYKTQAIGQPRDEVFHFKIQPSCIAPDFDIVRWTSKVITSHYTLDTSCQNVLANDNFPIIGSNFTNFKPQFQVLSPPTAEGLSSNLSWDFQLCSNIPADFTWMAFENPSTNLELLDVVSSGDTLNSFYYTNSSGAIDSSLLFVEIDSLFPSGNCIDFQLIASNTFCGSILEDSILAFVGFDCAEFPFAHKDSARCITPIDTFRFRIVPSGLSMVVNSIDSVLLCDTAVYTVSILNPKQGTLEDVEFFFDPPVGLVYDTGRVRYPLTNPFFDSLPVPTVGFGPGSALPGWDLNNLFFGDSGLMGDTALNKIILELQFSPVCGHNPGNFIRFFSSGINGCGVTLVDTFQNQLFLESMPPSDTLIILDMNTSDTALGCDDTTQIELVVSNLGIDTVQNLNFLLVTVPNVLDTANLSSPIDLFLTDGQGNNLLFWVTDPLPAGTDTFTFDLVLPFTSVCTDTLIEAHIINLDTLLCIVDNSQCPIETIVDSRSILLNICCDTSTVPMALITSSTDAGCFGDSTGTVTVTVIGGSQPFLYVWSNGGTDLTITGLPAGSYTVTVTDASGQTVTASVVIAQSVSNLNALFNMTLPTCAFDDDATATVSVTGGATPYTYSWSDGTTDSTLTGLGAGTYSVSITDAKNCQVSATIFIPNPPPLVPIVISTDVSCPGGVPADGSASVSVTGGVSPYTYLWSNGGKDSTITGLVAGTYVVTVTDSIGCDTALSVVVNLPPELNANSDTIPPNCAGGTDGIVLVAPTGGTPPYSFLWTTGATTSTITGLSAGTFGVTITDANGCTFIGVLKITDPPVLNLNITATDVTCNGDSNGTVNASITGGTPPYSYLWSNGASDSTLTGLSGDTLILTATDSNGCTVIDTAIITEPSLLAVAINVTQPSCVGLIDGEVTANVSGGTAPYTYLWSNGITDSTLTGIATGSFIVFITDANGCTATASTTVTGPFDFPNGFVVSAGDSNWVGLHVTINDTLLVQGGSDFKIINSTVEFGPAGIIIIETTAKLTVDNSILTDLDSCNQFWRGIVIEGDITQSQFPLSNSPQGHLAVRNNSSIKHAKTAVLVSSGGIVKAQNSTFTDNRIGVWFKTYSNFFPPNPNKKVGNLSSFASCDFITTAGYLNYQPVPSVFHLFVFLHNVDRISFRGVNFKNTAPALFAFNKRGIGILSIGASYSVTPEFGIISSPPPQVLPVSDSSAFENLYIGIYAANIFSSKSTFGVRQVGFEKNFAGIVQYGIRHASIIQNEFVVADNTSFFGVGLYTSGSSRYQIEENTFSSLDANAFRWGTFINHSASPPVDFIYNNTYHDIRTGIQATESTPFGIIANRHLQIRCNHFINNITFADFLVSSGRVATHGKCKGKLIDAAGNDFSTSATFNIGVSSPYYSPTKPLIYFHHKEIPAPFPFPPQFNVDPNSITANVLPINCKKTFNPIIDCPSHLKGKKTKFKIKSQLDSLAGSGTVFKSRLDAGGNTDGLIALINQFPQIPAKQIKDALINASPLSTKVLVVAVKKNDPLPKKTVRNILEENAPFNDTILFAVLHRSFPLSSSTIRKLLLENDSLSDFILSEMINLSPSLNESDIRHILEANMPLSDVIIDELINRNPPFDQHFIEDIMEEQVEALLGGTEEECKTNEVELCHIPPGKPGNRHTICVKPKDTLAHFNHGDNLGACLRNGDIRDSVEAAFGVSSEERESVLSDLIRLFLTDTNEFSGIDSVIALLENELVNLVDPQTKTEKQRLLAEGYMETGKLTEAGQLLSSLSAAGLYGNYPSLMQTVIGLQQQGKDFFEINNDVALRQTVENFAADSLTFGYLQARAWLTLVDSIIFPPFIEIPSTPSAKMAGGTGIGGTAIKQEKTEMYPSLIKIYPNPISGNTTIVLTSELSAKTSSIVLYDVTGRKVKEYPISRKVRKVSIPTSEIGSGLFFVQLVADGQVIEIEKVIVAR